MNKFSTHISRHKCLTKKTKMPISSEYYDYLLLQRAKLLSQTERFLTNNNCFSQERQNVLDWVNLRLNKYDSVLEQFKWMNTEGTSVSGSGGSGSSGSSSISSSSSLDGRSRSGSINSCNSLGSNTGIAIST